MPGHGGQCEKTAVKKRVVGVEREWWPSISVLELIDDSANYHSIGGQVHPGCSGLECGDGTGVALVLGLWGAGKRDTSDMFG